MKQSIIESIRVLPPLSESVKDIISVCDDMESSLLDVVSVVKKDPTASATLLKIANSSLYGNRNVKIVDRAVGMFGKAVTKSFLISRSVIQSFKIDLTPYNMTEEQFANISLARVILMSEWYNDIDKKKLEILATTSQLANIGQLIIAKELIDTGKANDFKKALINCEDEIDELETEFVGHTSIEVSAEILKHWKLDSTLVNSLLFSYSSEALNRCDEVTRPYAIANFCVLNAIDTIGKENESHMEEILDILDHNDLGESKFTAILEQIRSNLNA